MRAVVRAQLSQAELSVAIATGIREAQREAGRARHARRMEEFKAADEEAGGSICKNVDSLIKEEALIIQQLFTTPTPANTKAARTEIERLIDYIGFRRECQGS